MKKLRMMLMEQQLSKKSAILNACRAIYNLLILAGLYISIWNAFNKKSAIDYIKHRIFHAYN